MGDVQSGTDRRGPPKEPGSTRRNGHRSGQHWPASEPRSFGPPLVAVDGMSTLPVMAPLAIGEADLALAPRQAQAQAGTSYWQAVSAARARWDVLTANADYWTGFLSDDPDRRV